MQSYLNQNPFDASSSRIGSSEHNDIISSTLIEDIRPITNNNNIRYKARENGDHSALRISPTSQLNSSSMNQLSSTLQPRHIRDADEGSSSHGRDKAAANPFSVTNDSTVVNFSAHLQRAKSLFTNRTSVSARLRNYRMRNPQSSLYRSTSSLCDNNSVSSNASSAMSSPFYSGQTTFGGASATSKRMNTSIVDSQLNMSKFCIFWHFSIFFYFYGKLCNPTNCNRMVHRS